MRQLFSVLSLLGLMTVVGCDKHVAGICDCDRPGPHCASCCAYHHFAPGVQMDQLRAAPAAPGAVETPKAMPKEVEKKDDEKKELPPAKGEGSGAN